MDAATPMEAAPRAIERVRERVSAADLAAAGAFAVSLVLYVRTLLPGVSFTDWADGAIVPARDPAPDRLSALQPDRDVVQPHPRRIDGLRRQPPVGGGRGRGGRSDGP